MLKRVGVFGQIMLRKRFRHSVPPHETAEAQEREFVKELKKERNNKEKSVLRTTKRKRQNLQYGAMFRLLTWNKYDSRHT